jgi:hypothetical protein
MKRSRRRNGFVLIIVVILLGAMGLAIAIWAAQTRDLMIQTKLQNKQAGLDNAIASAAEWAKINPKTVKKSPEGQWIRLDLNQLQISGLECHYRIVDKKAAGTEIEITAIDNFRSCPIKKTVRLSL